MQELFHTFSQDGPIGRRRTMEFLLPIIERVKEDLPLPFEMVETWEIAPSSEAWTQEESGEGVKWRPTERLSAWLEDFLRRKVPGPILISAVYQGEDLGLAPHPLFQEQIPYMDPPMELEERVTLLASRLAEIMERLTGHEVESYFTVHGVPREQWWPHIHLQPLELPRRGSFYYPDLSVYLWAGKPYRALAVPGWWQPSHPEFPMPVEFEPGEPIGIGPTTLLGLEARTGNLVSISRRLARAHGTQLLPPVGEEDDLPPSRQATRHQTFSNLLLSLLTTFLDEVGEPLRMHFSLYAGVSYERPVVKLHHVVPYQPRRYTKAIPFPTGMGKKVVVDPAPAKGSGSRIARYIIRLDECSDPSTLRRCLDLIDRNGEGAVLLVGDGEPDRGLMTHRGLMVTVWNGRRPGEEMPGNHVWLEGREAILDYSRLIPLTQHGYTGLYLSPCPLKISFADAKGMIWL